jgi:TfoX/Sxy family transcriptional regulator of competence genes
MASDETLAERIRHVLRDRTDVTERRMFGGLAFLFDGRMCLGIVNHDLMVRVVAREMPAVLRRRHVRPMDFTGKPLRGFVFVAPEALTTARSLVSWIDRGLRFAESNEAPPRKPAARPRARRASVRGTRVQT